MVVHETLERIRLAANRACSNYAGLPVVEAYGAMSVLVVVPEDTRKAIGDVEVVAETIMSDPTTLCTGYARLSDWFASNGEVWTEDEEWTLLFDVRREACTFSSEEIAEHRAENIIEIDPTWKKGNDIVFMPIKKKFFDAIARNEKKFEWRDYCETWVRKIIAPHARFVKFQCGYAKNAPKMVWEIKDIRLAETDEEGGERFSPYDIPPMVTPEHIVIELGRRVL